MQLMIRTKQFMLVYFICSVSKKKGLMENQNTKERLARPRSTLADVTGSINWDILEWLLFMQEARHNSCKLTSALEKQGPGICFLCKSKFLHRSFPGELQGHPRQKEFVFVGVLAVLVMSMLDSSMASLR
jgi:hypothetical protein